MADIGFEEQLEQERLARELEEARKEDGLPRTRTDLDGTEYEWDVEKKAWFPKIDADFIAKYQMKYGESTDKDGEAGKDQEAADYAAYMNYYESYNQAGAQHDQLLSRRKVKAKVEETHDETMEKLAQLETRMQQGDPGDDGGYSREDMEKYTEEEKQQYNDYWSYYYGTDHHDYYSDCMAQYQQEGEGADPGESSQGQGQDDKDQDKDGTKKKGKKRKAAAQPARPEGWFEVDESNNTNVYVSNLPPDITDDEFQELMGKYGLVMYDPRTRKPKLKLYRDEHGKPKGDGRCCYIKRESVDLAFSILDGYDIRGHSVKVALATFQMKGEFDVSKKKKKLTNKEKNKMKEKQAKLFDWRPEQPGARPKHEKVVILKNMFDPKSFEENPLLINTVRDDVRAECVGFGDIKKIVVYDRHTDGVISVAYKEAEEADLAVSSLNHRWFAQRRIIAAAWDGKAKYEVAESETEREARLQKWQNFLETDTKGDKQETSQSQDTADSTQSGQDVSNTDIPDGATLKHATAENSSTNTDTDNIIHTSSDSNEMTTGSVKSNCVQETDDDERSENNR